MTTEADGAQIWSARHVWTAQRLVVLALAYGLAAAAAPLLYASSQVMLEQLYPTLPKADAPTGGTSGNTDKTPVELVPGDGDISASACAGLADRQVEVECLTREIERARGIVLTQERLPKTATFNDSIREHFSELLYLVLLCSALSSSGTVGLMKLVERLTRKPRGQASRIDG